jgi:hypothetical protein
MESRGPPPLQPLGIHLMWRVRVVGRRPARVIEQVADSTPTPTMAVAWIAADLILEASSVDQPNRPHRTRQAHPFGHDAERGAIHGSGLEAR